MSNDIPSWRSLASVASRSIKGYVAQRDFKRPALSTRSVTNAEDPAKPSWSQWAGQKLRAFGQGGDPGTSFERVSLFPGWARRKYHQQENATIQDNAPFDVELYVSGFASRSSGPGFGTRAGKAFLRIAKSYAALPKLAVGDSSFTPNGGPASRSADDLIESMHLPVRPDQMTDEAELEELTEKMRQIEFDAQSQESVASSSSSRSANQVSANDMFDERYTPPGSMIGSDVLQKFHANLEARLHPFWASTLGSRKVHLAVYAANPNTPDFFKSPPIGSPESDEEAAFYRQPIASVNVVTSPDGSFQAVFTLEWARMCQHPAALHIAFGDPDTEHSLYVTADLMPPPSRPPSPNYQPSYPTYAPRAPRKLAPTASTTLDVPITHTSVRLISDIDDTIKISGILSGARATFYNVFVKDLGDLIVPGMGEWYTEMWKRGVRFHYVSNGPFELLPVVVEFLTLSRLPPGSIRLKSYAGRSLFGGLLSAPAERKRAGTMEVLDNFSNARFILVGDSGEQDLELYGSIARERPYQILGIFIRDASQSPDSRPLDDPTGEQALRDPTILAPSRRGTQLSMSSVAPSPGPSTPTGASRPPFPSHRPHRSFSGSEVPTPTPANQVYAVRAAKRTQSYTPPSPNAHQYFPSGSLIDSPVSEEPPAVPNMSTASNMSYPPQSWTRQGQDDDRSSTSSRVSGGGRSSTSSYRPPMTDVERRRYDLQQRVWRVRADVPASIALRVFCDPSECVEAGHLLDSLNLGKRQP